MKSNRCVDKSKFIRQVTTPKQADVNLYGDIKHNWEEFWTNQKAQLDRRRDKSKEWDSSYINKTNRLNARDECMSVLTN